jgi:hypothetical protein
MKLANLFKKILDKTHEKATTPQETFGSELSPIEAYLNGGMIPWSHGYSKYKNQFIQEAIANENLRQCFRDNLKLPAEFGKRLDERVVEYPWVLSRLRDSDGLILDAGSTFNTPLILDLPQIQNRNIVICTLETDWITLNPKVSYLFCDLRDTLFKDEIFESIVCISTIEHVGMASDLKKYSIFNPYPEADRESYQNILIEFWRLLKPGGQLLLTVPFGRYEDHGWLQQFDSSGIQKIASIFNDKIRSQTYYRYHQNGWQIATPDECAESEYFNIHAVKDFDSDYAAAARAVACLELEK